MARKRVIISSAGGISAGSPFVLGQGLIVGQVNPAFAVSARFGQLPDAMLSFIAPDIGGAAQTFVLGAGSQVVGNAPKGVLVGPGLIGRGGPGVGDKIVMVGGNIDPGVTDNFGDSIIVGWDWVVGGTGTNHTAGVFLGNALSFLGNDGGNGSVTIGNNAQQTDGDSVTIGSGSFGEGEAVAIGKTARGCSQGVAIGKTARVDGGSAAIAIGFGAQARSVQGIAIGFQAGANLDHGIALGRAANASAFANTIAIGQRAEVFEANACNIGGDQSDGADMRVLRLGPNTLSGYPGLSIFLPSADAGTNVAGPNTTIRAGISTGNSVTKSRVIFQSGTQGASGGTYQTSVDRFRIAPGGVAGVPSIELVNQISTPGAQAATLLNSPKVGNPTVWMEILYNGVLTFVPGWQ